VAKNGRLLSAAVLLTAASAGALAMGIYTLAKDPNYFTASTQVPLAKTPAELASERIMALVSGPAGEDAVAKQIRSEDVKGVYAVRENRPIWSGSPLALIQTAHVIDILRHAGDDGLNPNDYHVAEIAKLKPQSPEEVAAYDVLLTDAALRYASDLRFGRTKAKSVDRDIDVPAEAYDVNKALAEAVQAGTVADFLKDLQPEQAEYRALKAAFLRYRDAAESGSWAEVGSKTSLADLRPRLAIEDPSLSAEAREDNSDVAAALTRYQDRNRLRADGKLNGETIRALNVSATQRAAQVAANMERWRWYPSQLEPTRIVVNVTEATLNAFHDGELVLTSKVVVGDQDTRTPVLRAEAKAVLVHPPWNVPQSIIRNEILPKLRANPGYLASQSMRIRGGSGSTLRLQQTPGPHNALGTLKFEMPNKFNVYLHDTPTKAAFARDDRTVSHGCVRVQQILPLGSVALTGDPEAGLQRINSLIPSRKTRTLALPAALPIYIAYWTAVPDENGAVAFRPDIYGRDKRMIAALGGFNLSAISAEGPS
jgi:murein L,D-transpeptidase YcbB/YkuD